MANFIITSKNIFSKDNVIFENWTKGVRYKINDADLKDVRGTYKLQIGNMKEMKLKVSGEFLQPEIILNLILSKPRRHSAETGQQITFSFELKQPANKGIYRLVGYVDEKNRWKGNAEIPSGEWVKWTATFTEPFVPETKRTRCKKINSLLENCHFRIWLMAGKNYPSR